MSKPPATGCPDVGEGSRVVRHGAARRWIRCFEDVEAADGDQTGLGDCSVHFRYWRHHGTSNNGDSGLSERINQLAWLPAKVRDVIRQRPGGGSRLRAQTKETDVQLYRGHPDRGGWRCDELDVVKPESKVKHVGSDRGVHVLVKVDLEQRLHRGRNPGRNQRWNRDTTHQRRAGPEKVRSSGRPLWRCETASRLVDPE